MGAELELSVLLAFAVIGQSTFARFEIETPAIRKILKWFTMAGLTLVLYRWFGHWALLLQRQWVSLGRRFISSGVAETASIHFAQRRLASTTSCAAGRGRTRPTKCGGSCDDPRRSVKA